MRAMLADFNKHQVKVNAVGGLKKGWAMLSYRESITAKTSFTVRSQAGFKTKEEFLNYRREEKKEQANKSEELWAKYFREAEAGTRLRRHKDGELQLEVELESLVLRDATIEHSKNMDLMGETVKKTTQEKISNMEGSLFINHGQVGEVELGMASRLQGLAEASSNAGGTSADSMMAGMSQSVGDVKGLGAEFREKEEERLRKKEAKKKKKDPAADDLDEDQSEVEDDADADGDGDDVDVGKKKAAFNFEKGMKQKNQIMQEKYRTLASDVDAMYCEAKGELDKLEKFDIEVRRYVRAEELV